MKDSIKFEETCDSIEGAVMRMKLAFREGDKETARQWHERLETLVQALFETSLHPPA